MKFEREPYSQKLVDEMMPLWEKHYKEIAVYQDIPLDPNLNIYARANENGTLRIFTARQNLLLGGYQVFFVHPHPHYQQSIQAVQDILFVSVEMRRGLNGYRFIKWCDDELQKEGIQVVMQHVKARHDFGRLLERMGYELQDLIYSRRFK